MATEYSPFPGLFDPVTPDGPTFRFPDGSPITGLPNFIPGNIPLGGLPQTVPGTPGIAPGSVPTSPSTGNVLGALFGGPLTGGLGSAILNSSAAQALGITQAASGTIAAVESFVVQVGLHIITVSIATLFIIAGLYLVFKDQVDPAIREATKAAGEAALA